MMEDAENVPAYRTIRMTAPDAPVAALADIEAWRAREKYPELRGAGGPVFGIAREREQGGWQLEPHFSGCDPQDARDSLGSVCRHLAQEAEEAGDQAARQECLAAAERLDWEEINELTLLGTRYRVVRAERFIRMGPEGPEPPRPTDPDPSPTGQAHREADPADGFVLDPITATGMSEGILKIELLTLVHKTGTVPPDVQRDSVRASHSHPGGVLLPPVFVIAERTVAGWRPESAAIATSPQSARDSLALEMRVLAPVMRKLTPVQRAEYARAADLLDATRPDVLEVGGRHLRVARVERMVRIGPDGPEGPRPSDRSLHPPVMVHDQQLRAQGLVSDDEDEEQPLPVSPEVEEMSRLMDLERERRAALEAREQRAREHRARVGKELAHKARDNRKRRKGR
ncbi:DUF5954 family protein [Kitasatospora kifunensis]|uniref:PE-PGRS family protein n=1 Tax=Kitasatospora kifunensis TaxID=58351 RepID=A0A7W7VYX5_KITKI|nr:DUF5954 family protein [Kitasatospora kifunensis]MBB4927149.1 hypothetical protein [Kitasatospora kifunensis]